MRKIKHGFVVAGRGHRRRLAAGLMLLAVPLAGCSVSVADLPLVGVPEGAPARPKDPGTFPAVHDLPAPRQQAVMDRAEQERLQSELAATRDKQEAAAAAGAAAPAKPAGR
ncbi:MAG TPA: hypothetical protein VN130_09380 [Xanthobacteraceae bacterium]|nr:hypothetical protein [Xanthobacteraceae bacterium]